MTRAKAFVRRLFADSEQVTFFTAYGFRRDGGWEIPLRAWVHEPRRLVEGFATLLLEAIGPSSKRERENFTLRLATIAADSESRERVVCAFDKDPLRQWWQIQTREGNKPKSDLNGVIRGIIRLSDDRAKALIQAQETYSGWLRFQAVSADHSGDGRIQLIEPEGVSVISDIDDTLKITEVPAGGKIVVRNTFLRDFVATPEMADRYKRFGNAAFHYVSGAPWQLFRPLLWFLQKESFPEGSFHMKNVPTNLLLPRTWKDLLKLSGDATFEQKLQQISEILERFPGRKFILVGDSGEHDPEIYRRLRNRFNEQVVEIVIRDVINARHLAPDRLEGMTVIPAKTIYVGESQFY